LESSQPAIAVARGSAYLLLRNIVNAAVSIGAFAFIARLISRQEMGEVAVLLLVTAVAQLVSGLGLAPAVTKFVSSFDATREHDEMRYAAYTCLMINGLATSVIVATMFFSGEALGVLLFGDSSKASLFRLLTLEIAAVSVTPILTSVLLGLRCFKEIALASTCTFAVRQTAVVVLLELGFGVPGFVVGYGIGDSLYAVAMFVYAGRLLGPPKIRFDLTGLFKFSAPLLLRDAATYAWTWFDRALLLPLVALSQLGAYNVAVTAYAVLGSAPQAISDTLFPHYSHLYAGSCASSSIKDLEYAVRKASRYVSFFTIPLAVGLAVTALPAATLLAGDIYADSAYPLAILSISLALACLVSALSEIFVVLNKTTTSAGITIASVAASLVVGAALVPHLGILAGSVAHGLSLVTALSLSAVLLRRIMRVRFDLAAYRSAWLAGLVMATVVLALQATFYSKYLLPVYIIVGGAIFFLALRVLRALNEEDFQLVSDFLGPRFGFMLKPARRLLLAEPAKPR
jgi:O-antigen/teichoic acid export membrane protein